MDDGRPYGIICIYPKHKTTGSLDRGMGVIVRDYRKPRIDADGTVLCEWSETIFRG